MATALRITVAAGGDKTVTHDVPFGPLSEITVKSAGQVHAFSEVAKVALVEKHGSDAGEQVDTPVGMDSAEAALEYASGLADADAGEHLEKALVKWPRNKQLQEALDAVAEKIRTVAPEE